MVGDARKLRRIDAGRRMADREVGPDKCQLIDSGQRGSWTHVEMELGSAFPVINLSQASAHSRITSIAYLQTVSLDYAREEDWRTSCSCTRQRMQTGSRACRPESCRCGTTHWWRGASRGDGARHPRYLVINSARQEKAKKVGWQTIELRGQGILLVNHNDFPIRLLLVQESHDA